jgi:hypothetical protein
VKATPTSRGPRQRPLVRHVSDPEPIGWPLRSHLSFLNYRFFRPFQFLTTRRRNYGSEAPDAYRPRPASGVYIPTTITISSMWPTMKPFAIASGSQFRPEAPLALDSPAWAADYNEIKEFGGQTSAKRTAEQTEIARFWLVGPPVAYHPFVRPPAISPAH